MYGEQSKHWTAHFRSENTWLDEPELSTYACLRIVYSSDTRVQRVTRVKFSAVISFYPAVFMSSNANTPVKACNVNVTPYNKGKEGKTGEGARITAYFNPPYFTFHPVSLSFPWKKTTTFPRTHRTLQRGFLYLRIPYSFRIQLSFVQLRSLVTLPHWKPSIQLFTFLTTHTTNPTTRRL